MGTKRQSKATKFKKNSLWLRIPDCCFCFLLSNQDLYTHFITWTKRLKAHFRITEARSNAHSIKYAKFNNNRPRVPSMHSCTLTHTPFSGKRPQLCIRSSPEKTEAKYWRPDKFKQGKILRLKFLLDSVIVPTKQNCSSWHRLLDSALPRVLHDFYVFFFYLQMRFDLRTPPPWRQTPSYALVLKSRLCFYVCKETKTSSTKYFEVFLQQGRRQGRAGARPAYFSEHARQAGGAIFGKPDGLRGRWKWCEVKS